MQLLLIPGIFLLDFEGSADPEKGYELGWLGFLTLVSLNFNKHIVHILEIGIYLSCMIKNLQV